MPANDPYNSDDFNNGLLDNVIAFDSAMAYSAANVDEYSDGLPEVEDDLWTDEDSFFFPDDAA